MDSSIALTSDSLGSLFVIPESDWTSISKRVGLTILAKDIAPSIARYLVDFPALETVCQKWKDTTFPGLIAQSENLSNYCVQARDSWTKLQQAISGLDPNRDLPPEVKREAEGVIGSLSQSTASLNQQFAPLSADVLAFTTQNQVIDSHITSYTDRLGPDWKSINPSTTAVDKATGLVMGAWQAISDDLNAIATGRIVMTTQLLLSLDIASALLSWEHLRDEAHDFASMAKGQEQYLSGQWIGMGAAG